MRAPAYIKSWLSVEKMFQWLQDAPDDESRKRRRAIWLTYTRKLHARKVAKILGVSTQAVWLWVRQYNNHGPEGLNRKGRGGRRWGFMTLQQEAELLKPLMKKIRSGTIPKTAEIKLLVEKKLGRKVSTPYIYRILSRHSWYEKIAQSNLVTGPSAIADNFQKFSQPWLRKD